MQYKNISDRDLSIPGVGIVAAGGLIESTKPIVNANLEQVAEKKKEEKAEEIKNKQI